MPFKNNKLHAVDSTFFFQPSRPTPSDLFVVPSDRGEIARPLYTVALLFSSPMLKEKFMRSKIQPADDDGDCPPKSNELQ